MFDACIVIISILNVILTASGLELPNAKLLRLLRLGRAGFHTITNTDAYTYDCTCKYVCSCNYEREGK